MPTYCGLLERDCIFNKLPNEGKCGFCASYSPPVKEALIRKGGINGGKYSIISTTDLFEAILLNPSEEIIFIISRGTPRKMERPIPIKDYYTVVTVQK